MDYYYKKKCAAIATLILLKRRKRRKHREVWVKDWISKRHLFSIENNLIKELANGDPECHQNFLRMNTTDFDYLLGKVSPLISKQDTNMREAITAKTRLIVTLRYLATGKCKLL